MNDHPERFSPNVVTRPLYQEVLLPNLCYIGGGGELAYWFQLKHYFDNAGVTFPALLLRNSVLVRNTKHKQKQKALGIELKDLFKSQNVLLREQTIKRSEIEIDFSQQKDVLKQQFKDLYGIAEKTDKSFLGAVSAQERKQIKGLEQLEKRLLKAQKRVLRDELDRLSTLQNTVFPNYSLQERHVNFSELYLEFGERFIDELMVTLQPLQLKFTVLTLD